MKHHFPSFSRYYLCFLSLLKSTVNLPSTQTLNCKASCILSFTTDISSQILVIPHHISCLCSLNSNSCFMFRELTSTVILLSQFRPTWSKTTMASVFIFLPLILQILVLHGCQNNLFKTVLIVTPCFRTLPWFFVGFKINSQFL